jgi:hypothetical protein
MAAARSSSSSQIDRPQGDDQGAQQHSEHRAAGFRVPAPRPARALPASLMNFWASAAGVGAQGGAHPVADVDQHLAMAGPDGRQDGGQGQEHERRADGLHAVGAHDRLGHRDQQDGQGDDHGQGQHHRYWEVNQPR